MDDGGIVCVGKGLQRLLGWDVVVEVGCCWTRDVQFELITAVINK